MGNLIQRDILIWPYEQMIYAQSEIYPRDWDAQNSLTFWDTNESSNLGQSKRPSDNRQKSVTVE